MATGFPRVTTALIGIALALVVARSARAEGEDPIAQEDRLRHFAVNGNPFALALGRLSADLQWLPVRGHAIVVSPYALYLDPSYAILSGGDPEIQSGYGVELGYRYYSGGRGANGFFAGGGAMIGRTHVDAADNGNPPVHDFGFLGGFVDLGVQAIMPSGFLIGGGFGFQVTKELASGTVLKPEPRLLFTLGYAF